MPRSLGSSFRASLSSGQWQTEACRCEAHALECRRLPTCRVHVAGKDCPDANAGGGSNTNSGEGRRDLDIGWSHCDPDSAPLMMQSLAETTPRWVDSGSRWFNAQFQGGLDDPRKDDSSYRPRFLRVFVAHIRYCRIPHSTHSSAYCSCCSPGKSRFRQARVADHAAQTRRQRGSDAAVSLRTAPIRRSA